MKLSQKINSGVVISILIFSISFLLYFVEFERKTEVERFEKSVKRNNKLIVSTMLSLLWNYQSNEIEDNVISFFDDDEIMKIIVTDEFGVVHGNIERNKKYDIGKEIRYKLPLMKESGVVGNVEIVYSTEKLERKLMIIRNNLILLIIGLTILCVVVVIIISRIVLRPIKEIIAGLKKVDEGTFTYKILIKTKDEFKDIELYFNKMVDSILRETNGRKAKEEEIVRAEKEKSEILLNMNNELERKVKERTSELIKSMGELKDAQQQLIDAEKMAALGNLVAGVAHEINTPIGVCLTAASHLKEKTRSFDKEYKEENISKEDLDDYLEIAGETTEIMINNIRRADVLIQNFKQIAVDQSNEEIRLFNMKEYVDSIIYSLYPKWKKTKHKVNMTCDEQINMKSYPGVFYQILSNLIANSLFHGFEGIEEGEINIEIVMPGEKEILIKYTDNGKGIKEEIINRIYEPFFTTKRGNGGSGLGMNIVYNLVTRKLGGTIVTTSEVGKGICIEMRIPIKK